MSYHRILSFFEKGGGGVGLRATRWGGGAVLGQEEGRGRVAAPWLTCPSSSWPSFFLGHWGGLALCGPRRFGHLATTCTQATPAPPCTPRHRTCARPFGGLLRTGRAGGISGKRSCALRGPTRCKSRRWSRPGPPGRPPLGDDGLVFADRP